MRYEIQERNSRGRWTTRAYDARSLEAAIAQVCSLDQDGLFAPGFRVVYHAEDGTKSIVMTYAIWSAR